MRLQAESKQKKSLDAANCFAKIRKAKPVAATQRVSQKMQKRAKNNRAFAIDESQ